MELAWKKKQQGFRSERWARIDSRVAQWLRWTTKDMQEMASETKRFATEVWPGLRATCTLK